MSALPQDVVSTCVELRELAGELEIRVLFATMNADDRWRLLEPRFKALADEISGSKEVSDLQLQQLAYLRALLGGLATDLN